jgi:hypothetical protein
VLTEQQIALIRAGAYGVLVVSDTVARTGLFGRLICYTACTFTELKSELLTGSLTGVSLPAGTEIDLPAITAFTLSTGTLAANRMPPITF